MKTIEVVTTKNVEPQALAHLVGQEIKVTYRPPGAWWLTESLGTVLFADAVVLDLKKAAGDTQTVLAEQIIKVEVL